MLNVVILMNKKNPNYDPSMEENKENPRLVTITDRQSINDELHIKNLRRYTASRKLRIILRLFKSFLVTPSPRNTSNAKPSLTKKTMR